VASVFDSIYSIEIELDDSSTSVSKSFSVASVRSLRGAT